jgi:preprotein translocase subunit YajC
VNTYALIAAEGAPPAKEGEQPQQTSPGGTYGWLILMGLLFALFYFILIRPQKKKEQERQKQREEMLKNLKKNDHVASIGGIHGVVVNVTEDEVVVRVDDRSDARIRFSREAISKVLDKEGGGDGTAATLGDDAHKGK